jgi:uncharacterized protein YbjT (DUF2867 family)
VSHFVYISAHSFTFTPPPLRGYVDGKRHAEDAVRAAFGPNGHILRPGFIFGNRTVGKMTLPLQCVGRPLNWALAQLPSESFPSLLRDALLPPVAVEAVGDVAARAALGEINKTELSVWDILALTKASK